MNHKAFSRNQWLRNLSQYAYYKRLLFPFILYRIFFPFESRFPACIHSQTRALVNGFCRLCFFLSSINFFSSINLLFEFPKDFPPTSGRKISQTLLWRSLPKTYLTPALNATSLLLSVTLPLLLQFRCRKCE